MENIYLLRYSHTPEYFLEESVSQRPITLTLIPATYITR